MPRERMEFAHDGPGEEIGTDRPRLPRVRQMVGLRAHPAHCENVGCRDDETARHEGFEFLLPIAATQERKTSRCIDGGHTRKRMRLRIFPMWRFF
jgi:hypothetical protein